ncbi:MAG: hypothetical protein MJZ31_11795 [Bacteroidales bacterium]|nr:hypothetical protein [Bacteroidales bacterium]
MSKRNIIDEVISTEKTRENARKAIPFLIHLALTRKQGTYNDLTKYLGYTKYRGIGSLLGNIENVILRLNDVLNITIPTINALIVNASGLPSNGFDFVYPLYSEMNEEAKLIFVKGHNEEAYDFPYWDLVLKELGLEPLTIVDPEYIKSLRSSSSSYGGGEGEEHKAIKEYILKNPKSVGIKNVASSEVEYKLASADRIDVCFELKDKDHIAVEVKPSTAPQNDIARGIFQCIKYKALLDAERTLVSGFYQNSTLLVLAGSMSKENKLLASELGINFIENFKIG